MSTPASSGASGPWQTPAPAGARTASQLPQPSRSVSSSATSSAARAPRQGFGQVPPSSLRAVRSLRTPVAASLSLVGQRTPQALQPDPGPATEPSAGPRTSPALLESFQNYLAAVDNGSSPAGSRAASPSHSPQGERHPSVHQRGVSKPSAAEALVAELRKEIKGLKRALSESKSESGRKVLQLEREQQQLAIELESTKLKLERAESDRTFLLTRDSERSSKIESLQAQLVEAKARVSSDSEARRLQGQNAELIEAHALYKSEADDQISLLQSQIEQQAVANSAMAARLKHAHSQLSEQASTVAAMQRNASRAQSEAIGPCQKCAAKLREAENIDIIHKQLADQNAHITHVERRNAQLADQVAFYRSIQENTERLKEEKTALERQVDLLAATRAQLGEAQICIDELEAEKARWKSLIDDMGDDLGIDSPFALAKLLSAQRLEIATLKNQIGYNRLEQQRDHARELETEMDKLRDELRGMQASRLQDLGKIHRLEASQALRQKEIAALREQLRSYDIEEQAMLGSFDAQKSKRIADLEALVDEYKAHMALFEQRLSEAVALAEQSPKPPQGAADEQNIAALSSEIMDLKAHIETLQRQNDALQQSLGRGEFDPQTTRVLALAENPEARALRDRRAIVEALTAENKELRAQLKLAQASDAQPATGDTSSSAWHARASTRSATWRATAGDAMETDEDAAPDGLKGGVVGTGDMIPVESLRTKELECARLAEELQGANKRMLRLKEVFSSKIQEYREAVYTLLGFKLDIQQDGQVRLVSSYGSALHDPAFLFSSATGDQIGLQLQGGTGEGLARVTQNVRIFVEQRGSIPGLMAATTLELLDRRA
ncbi:coiled-coil domain-containing protein mad1 [Polyrhizophydium stewartii]|uniref:Spindle assembly checkpoint component MAD1 n=1 Tax=Polyrhizophydium stewartii TaxID=2732419 RepID=A0ABR4NAV4_9FUNG